MNAIPLNEQKKLHFALTNVGLRAQATAAGLVQLCKELRDANVLSQDAVDRIKMSIANEISVSSPRSICSEQYRKDIRERLDLIFDGNERIGPAEGLSYDCESAA